MRSLNGYSPSGITTLHISKSARNVSHCGTSLDSNGSRLAIMVHAFHGRDIDDHLHFGIGHKSFEAVSAAGYNKASSFSHGLLDRLFRARGEPLAETFIDHCPI